MMDHAVLQPKGLVHPKVKLTPIKGGEFLIHRGKGKVLHPKKALWCFNNTNPLLVTVTSCLRQAGWLRVTPQKSVMERCSSFGFVRFFSFVLYSSWLPLVRLIDGQWCENGCSSIFDSTIPLKTLVLITTPLSTFLDVPDLLKTVEIYTFRKCCTILRTNHLSQMMIIIISRKNKQTSRSGCHLVQRDVSVWETSMSPSARTRWWIPSLTRCSSAALTFNSHQQRSRVTLYSLYQSKKRRCRCPLGAPASQSRHCLVWSGRGCWSPLFYVGYGWWFTCLNCVGADERELLLLQRDVCRPALMERIICRR